MQPNEFLRHVVQVLDATGVEYMLTGSIASMYYGRPRLTNDIDIVADLKPDHLSTLARFFPEDEYQFDQVSALAAIAQRGQFNIIHPRSGLKADIILTRPTPFSKNEFSRRIWREVNPGLSASIARPEDVIIMKLEYHRQGGSEKHARDIVGMLAVSGDEIDRGYIEEWAARLGLAGAWATVLELSQR